MFLYHFTLQKPGGIVSAVCGNFSGQKNQEILVSRGNILELLKPDDQGKLQPLLSVNVFGIIRSVLAFRLTG
jgi:splicing factor 3B subunit 3